MSKRRHRRIIKRLETEFSANGLAFRGVSSDLSRSGLFVRTNKPFPPDTLVDLTIHLPGDKVSRLKGSVRRAVKTGTTTMKNGMGMEIVEMDHNYVSFLNTMLPAEEQVHDMDLRNSEAVPAKAKTDSSVRPEPRADSKDDALDSMISALFSKRNDN